MLGRHGKKQLLRVETYYKSGAAASECVKLVAPSAAPFGSFGAVSAGESTLPVVEYRTNPKDICGHVVTRLSVPAREEVMAHFGKLQQIICHRDVEARKVCESDLRRCHLARRCLCSGSGRTLGLFEDRFVSTLKRRFPRLSKHDVVLKRFRGHLKAGNVVIRLSRADGGGEHLPSDRWFHLSYANLANWDMSLVQLDHLR